MMADAPEEAVAGSGGAVVGRPPVRRNPVPSLLESLGRDHLDPGYAEAARRKAARAPGEPVGGARTSGRTTAVAAVVVACLAVGVLFGVAASTTETNEPRAEKTRSALLEDIDRAQQRQSELASSAAGLAEQLRATQSVLGAAGPLQTVAELEVAGQITPVTGPGLRVVIDEAPQDSTAAPSGGVILDRDVQLLVNDLWAAGAEAISIGGVRLQPRSAIRQAGGSILVDNRPVFWPITIEAVGEPSDLQVKLIGSPGVGRFSTFSQLYGITFEVSAQPEMSLPGGSGADLLFAEAPGTTPAAVIAPSPPASGGATAAPSVPAQSGSDPTAPTG
jgi:uncharacterized protein YlxW (UPF0749 family)